MRTRIRRLLQPVTITRRLPTDMGRRRIFVRPSVALGVLKPRIENFDNRLFRLVRQFVNAGDTVWDIGGNQGLFALPAAALAGPSGFVLTVEPDPYMAALLQRSTAVPHPDSAPIDILCSAITDSVGIRRLAIEESRAQNSLSDTGAPVPTWTLDGLLEHFPAPDVLKMDIEGAELMALRGARKLLSEVRPILILEVKEQNQSPVADMLRGLDYNIYRDDLTPIDTGRCSFENVIIPSERDRMQD